jgi:site-specific recombinase XerD
LPEAFAFVPCIQRGASTERAYRRFLKAEGRLEIAKPTDQVEQLRLRYQQYLGEVRGLASATIWQHLVTVDAFLSSSVISSGHLSALTSEHVELFVQSTSCQVRRQTLQHKVAHLRAFLCFCADRGETARGLDRIDTPRTYRGELPPRALGWDLVEKLLASVDRNNDLGRRDYAILHLMAYYGLRASEIAGLTLDAVNWKAGTMRVDQRKTRSTLILPLADQTLHILDQYLANRRPCAQVTVFLFLRALSPVGGMTNWAVCDIFTKRARESGLPLDGVSSYALRHSFAMRLLGQGVGVKTIGDLLGHHSLESTCVYLRIETDMLRTVALPVPGGAAH